MASVARFTVLPQNCPSGNRIVFLSTTARDARIGGTTAVKCAPTLLPLAVHIVVEVAAQRVPHLECRPHRTIATGKRTAFPLVTVRGARISGNEEPSAIFLTVLVPVSSTIT